MASRQPKPTPSCYYQLRVSLRYLKPEIWRRLVVPDTITLAQLHRLLQIVMGWTDSHMHEFRVGKISYGTPNPGWADMTQTLNEKRYTLAAIAGDKLKKFDYLYDFGDGWEHEVRIEKRLTGTEMPSHSQCTAFGRGINNGTTDRDCKIKDFLLEMCELFAKAREAGFKKQRAFLEQLILGWAISEFGFNLPVVKFRTDRVI
jgi:Plasmid pRiA4b ORF-3-like protein